MSSFLSGRNPKAVGIQISSWTSQETTMSWYHSLGQLLKVQSALIVFALDKVFKVSLRANKTTLPESQVMSPLTIDSFASVSDRKKPKLEDYLR